MFNKKEYQREYDKKRAIDHKKELKEYQHQYYLDNKEDCKNRAKNWRKENPEKVKESIHKSYLNHKKEKNIYGKKYREEHREEHNQANREWRKTHKLEKKEYEDEYRKKHPEIYRKNSSRQNKKNPEIPFIHRTIRRMLKDNIKTSHSYEYIGCSPGFLRNHIESLFQPEMTWNNYGIGKGKWSIDHIIPLSWWDLKNHPEHLFIASHWTNLQPMWQPENSS